MSTLVAHRDHSVAQREIDLALARMARMERDRAASLRQQAKQLREPLATTYRRRASELELSAWVHEVQAGLPETEIRTAA